MHASCSLMPLHFYIAPSLIFNYSVIDFSSCKIILSHPNCNVATDGCTSTTAQERHIPACVWHSNPAMESATFRGICRATSLYLETRGGCGMTLRWLSRLTQTDPSGLVGASKPMDKPLGKGHKW